MLIKKGKRGLAWSLIFIVICVFSGGFACSVESYADEIVSEPDTVIEADLIADNPETEEIIEEVEEGNEAVLFADEPDADQSGGLQAASVSAEQASLAAAAKSTGKVSAKFGFTKELRYEDYYTHDYYVIVNGKKMVAYCIQPRIKYLDKGSYSAGTYNSAIMKKALYYSYGYPGYSTKMKSYLAGKSLKKCYQGADGNYIFCHLLLSYFYDKKSNDSDAFKGVSTATKNKIIAAAKALEKWPDPPTDSKLSLSKTTLQATWDRATETQKTATTKLSGIASNYIKVPVPEGTSLVKIHSGKTTTVSAESKASTSKIYGGDSFYYKASGLEHKDFSSGTLSGSVSSFQPYMITSTQRQNNIFSITGGKDSVSFSVKWTPFGTLNLTKTSTEGAITDDNPQYSLKDAEYEIIDSGSNETVGKITTDETGKGSLDHLPYGTYVVKESIAPVAFALDEEKHDVTIESEATEVNVSEVPKLVSLKTSAREKDSNSNEFKAKGQATIVDTVEYENLIPGTEYIVKGVLMDKETGEAVCDSEGHEITGETTFTPEESSGSVQVDFAIDSDKLVNKSIVVFEKLFIGGAEVASHENINDEAQTVSITDKAVITTQSKPETPDQTAKTDTKPEEKTVKNEVKEQIKKTADWSPATGDATSIALLVIIIVISAFFGLAALFVRRE